MNEKWGCFLCEYETNFDISASGFLGNYHPLCLSCADKVLLSQQPDKFHMTYHYRLGDIEIVANVPISKYRLN